MTIWYIPKLTICFEFYSVTYTATSGKTDRVDYVVVRDADSAGNQRVQLVATLNYEDWGK